jgi:hypothetical protein
VTSASTGLGSYHISYKVSALPSFVYLNAAAGCVGDNISVLSQFCILAYLGFLVASLLRKPSSVQACLLFLIFNNSEGRRENDIT